MKTKIKRKVRYQYLYQTIETLQKRLQFIKGKERYYTVIKGYSQGEDTVFVIICAHYSGTLCI